MTPNFESTLAPIFHTNTYIMKVHICSFHLKSSFGEDIASQSLPKELASKKKTRLIPVHSCIFPTNLVLNYFYAITDRLSPRSEIWHCFLFFIPKVTCTMYVCTWILHVENTFKAFALELAYLFIYISTQLTWY